jgi:hypothetical protein
MKTAVLQETLLGLHSVPQELEIQLMLKLHHTQDTLFTEYEIKDMNLFKLH